MQSKHSKSRSLKAKVVAPVLAAVLVASGVVPAVTAGINSASAASVDGETGASTTYTAPVNANNADNKNNIFWTNATYYDYLTDDEVDGSWITSIGKYGTGFNGSEDEWFPYYKFNRDVVKAAADSHSDWATPLYFGNFCNTNGAFNTSGHHKGAAAGYDNDGAKSFKDATNSYNVTRFNYAANNSNGLNNMYQSYQGLMQNTLDANGNLMATGTLKAPYFDPDQLGSYATVINSKFPFRTSVENGVTKYEFDSTNAKDNVYFNWNGTTPTAVNYGSGTTHGVLDGIQYFMNPNDTDSSTGQKYRSGYGIFPFNNRGTKRYIYLNKDSTGWGTTYCYFYNNNKEPVGAAWPGTKMSTYTDGGNNLRIEIPTNATGLVFNNGNSDGKNQSQDYDNLGCGAYWLEANENGKWNVKEWESKPNDAGYEALDYGFGIKTEMNFRVPAGGVDNAGNPITFEYSGDDDLWVYITEIGTTNSQLVLDLGGNHKQAKGTINFKDKQAVANDVFGQGEQKKTFTFDYSKSYKMSIFYMERGMLESNCKMSFTMVPLGNAVTVTETINTADINSGLTNAVKALDSFRFTPTAGTNGTDSVSNLSYLTESGSTQTTSNSYFDLKSGGAAHFNTFFTTGDKINVTQSKASNSHLIYDTNWTYTDKVGNQGTSSGITSYTGVKQLINSTTNPDTFEFAELQADFVNTPKVAPVTITKEVTGLANGETDNTEFGGTVYVDLGNGWKTYDLAYKTSDTNTDTALTSGGKLADNGKLKNGRELTFEGIPQGAKVRFVEDNAPAGYSFVSVTGRNSGITVGASGNAIEVTNRALSGGGTIYVTKTLDDLNYTGNQFSFKAERVAKSGYVGGTDVVTATDSEDGVVAFDLSFTQTGSYLYKITETALPNAMTQAGYHASTATFYAKFNVVPGASGLEIDGTPKYYSDEACTTEVNAVFENTVTPASILIAKEDPAGTAISGTEFAVVKVADDTLPTNYAERINALIDADVNLNKGVTQNGTFQIDGQSRTTAAVAFDNLPIYQNGDQVYNMTTGEWQDADNYVSGSATPQVYMVFEYSPSNGYNTNKTVKFVTFPYQNKYDVTFDYTNVAVLMPVSSGSGMSLFLTLGFGILGTGLMMAMAYVLYQKRCRADRSFRHGRK